MNAFQYRLDKTMCECSAYVAFNKATNGQTDIKHETLRLVEFFCFSQTFSEAAIVQLVFLVINFDMFMLLFFGCCFQWVFLHFCRCLWKNRVGFFLLDILQHPQEQSHCALFKLRCFIVRSCCFCFVFVFWLCFLLFVSLFVSLFVCCCQVFLFILCDKYKIHKLHQGDMVEFMHLV